MDNEWRIGKKGHPNIKGERRRYDKGANQVNQAGNIRELKERGHPVRLSAKREQRWFS